MTDEEQIKKAKAHFRRWMLWSVIGIFPTTLLLAALQADAEDSLAVCFFVNLFIFIATAETVKEPPQ